MNFLLRKEKSKVPILIYQMGKVGSTTIFASLQKRRLNVATLHELDSPARGLSGEINRLLESGARGWKVITLVRDPLAQLVSGFFESMNRRGHAAYVGPAAYTNLLTVGDLEKRFYGRILDFNKHPFQWFDEQLKANFDIDVFSCPFEKDKGHQVYKTGPAEVLLIRYEDLWSVGKKAIGDFLGLDKEFDWVPANVSREKSYAGQYQCFKEEAVIPEDYINKIYSDRRTKHFYAEQEIARFIQKWKRNTPRESAKFPQENLERNQKNSDDISIRSYRAEDERKLLSLYQDVFRERPSTGFLRWKYSSGEIESLSHIAETKQGELIGFYGGLIRPFCYEGHEVLSSQAMDVMIREDYRKKGVFQRLGQRHFEDLKKCGVKVIYGFPTLEHFGAGSKKLRYEWKKSASILERTLWKRDLLVLLKPGSKEFRLVKTERFDSRADIFWEKIKRDSWCGLSRGKQYLNWRYCDQPGAKFDLFLVEDRKSGSPRGILVMGDSLKGKSEGEMILWEALTVSDDSDATRFLLESALKQCLLRKKKRLVLWLDGFKLKTLKQMRFRRYWDEGFIFAFKSLDPAVSEEVLKEKFYYTIGDTDARP